LNVHAIAGLVALNLLLVASGVAVLFAIAGWENWSALIRLSGLAYMLGVAANGALWVWELVLAVPFGLATALVDAALIAGAGILVGGQAGRRLPPWPRHVRLPAVSPVAAVFGALTVVYLEAMFRAARLGGLYEFDAWAFWVPKAKAIYYFGGLDRQFFRELINQSYPPLVPALQAVSFHFMGAVDPVTVHLQFWLLFAGFVAAVAGILSPRVRPAFLWPPLLLLVVAPHVGDHAPQATADFVLDELFVLGALLLALWLVDRTNAQLAAVTLLFAGAMLTKREGYLYVASAILAAILVTWRDRRFAWPRLFVVGIVAVAATVPWRILLAVRHLGGGGPEAGGTGLFSHFDRAWPSLRLALSTIFDFHIWLVAVPLLLLAVAAAFAAGARRLPAYTSLLVGFAVIGFTWATWAFPSLGISKNPALNPIVRLTGEVAILGVALTPLLLARAWRDPVSAQDGP
jgi:hypothetical protein